MTAKNSRASYEVIKPEGFSTHADTALLTAVQKFAKRKHSINVQEMISSLREELTNLGLHVDGEKDATSEAVASLHIPNKNVPGYIINATVEEIPASPPESENPKILRNIEIKKTPRVIVEVEIPKSDGTDKQNRNTITERILVTIKESVTDIPAATNCKVIFQAIKTAIEALIPADSVEIFPEETDSLKIALDEIHSLLVTVCDGGRIQLLETTRVTQQEIDMIALKGLIQTIAKEEQKTMLPGESVVDYLQRCKMGRAPLARAIPHVLDLIRIVKQSDGSEKIVIEEDERSARNAELAAKEK